MNNRKLKLKKLVLRSVVAQGFTSKYEKLKRKKWFFLRFFKSNKARSFWFFNPVRSLSGNKRARIKALFSLQKSLIHQSRLYFATNKTKLLKKSLDVLAASLKKGRLFRWVKFMNVLERKLVVLLMRSGFFNQLRLAVTAIKRGEVFVNGKQVLSPHFVVPLGAFVHVEGKSRTFVLRFAAYQMFIGKKSQMEMPLFRNSFVPRSFLPSRKTNQLQKRLRSTFIFQKSIGELFFIEDFFYRFMKKGQKRFSFKKNVSCWPFFLEAPIIPSHLLVDFVSMSFCLKSPVKANFVSVTSKQNFSPAKLWKI